MDIFAASRESFAGIKLRRHFGLNRDNLNQTRRWKNMCLPAVLLSRSCRYVFEMSESFDLIVVGAGPGGYVAAIRALNWG
jgi:hypothetical protein